MTTRVNGLPPILIVLSLVLLAAALAEAATPEQLCSAARRREALRHTSCHEKAQAKLITGMDFNKYHAAISKCRVKYVARWPKLQAKYPTAAPCSLARFVDNGNGTTTDNLTGLQWEKKTDDSTVHDKDNTYTWTVVVAGTEADGTVFTTFLDTLNGTCFAGQCDWRLPKAEELVTLLSQPYPCTISPCVDQVLFGPANGSYLCAETQTVIDDPLAATLVEVNLGYVTANAKYGALTAWAVRGGM